MSTTHRNAFVDTPIIFVPPVPVKLTQTLTIITFYDVQENMTIPSQFLTEIEFNIYMTNWKRKACFSNFMIGLFIYLFICKRKELVCGTIELLYVNSY